MRRLDALHLAFPLEPTERRGPPDAARSPECRWFRDRPPSCRNRDEADGDRGAHSHAEHAQTNAIAIRDGYRAAILLPQDLSISPAQAADRPPEPGLGDRYRRHSDGARRR